MSPDVPKSTQINIKYWATTSSDRLIIILSIDQEIVIIWLTINHKGGQGVLIKSYGLFWRRDEVEWCPGQGVKCAFRLMGRQGCNLPGLRLADFRAQQGIYILYGNHGPHYVGLTRKQGLGKRLKDHLTDGHQNLWDRFSWFGFRSVLKGVDSNGICQLKELAANGFGSHRQIIGDIEALLIRAMGLSNVAQMNFVAADEWVQVKIDETSHYLNRIACK